MTNKIQELKQNIEDLAEERANGLRDSQAFKLIAAELDALENDPYKNGDLRFDEGGMLCSEIEVNLRDFASEEPEVIDCLTDILSNDGMIFMYQSQYSQSRLDYTASICLGEPVIFDESPKRGHYAIYSKELGLEVDRVNSEEHGFALIEQAMRKEGVFENIVSTDYYGSPTPLSNPLSNKTDEQLQSIIDANEDA